MCVFNIEKLSKEQVYNILNKFDDNFNPQFSLDVDFEEYSSKLSNNAFFAICKVGEDIAGVVAFYLNSDLFQIYIPYVCVDTKYRKRGIAYQLICLIKERYGLNFRFIALEVDKINVQAKSLYERLGFSVLEDRGRKWYMKVNLKSHE